MRRAFVLATVAALVAGLAFSANAMAGLRLIRTTHSLTGTHRWYQQTAAGYEVLGGYYARHFNRTGRLVRVADGRRPAGVLRPAVSGVSAAQARSLAGVSRSARLVVLPGLRPRVVWAVMSADWTHRTLVDLRSGLVVSRQSLVKDATGQGRVFHPSPVVTLGDESLTDQNDTDYAALQPAYAVLPLNHLDGSGYLRGPYADVHGSTSRAFSASLSFLYGRSDNRFEQTESYWAVDGTQTYIQSLGFTDVNNEPQDIKVDQLGVDNSFYNPVPDYIKLGKGGVDDAEDAEVTWHEYGHAIQDDQVPGFGSTLEAGSIGEGFGDYWAVTMSEAYQPAGSDLPCVADWDSTSYTSTVPHCLRRVDLNLHWPQDNQGEVHRNGRIWSRALWDIHKALGRTTTDRIILEGQFSYAPDTTFRDAALATVAAAQTLYGKGAATTVRKAFRDRGLI